MMFLASVTRVIIVLGQHFQILLLLKKICTCIPLILNMFTLRFELQSHVFVTVESEDRMPQIRNGTIIEANEIDICRCSVGGSKTACQKKNMTGFVLNLITQHLLCISYRRPPTGNRLQHFHRNTNPVIFYMVSWANCHFSVLEDQGCR